MFFPAESPAGMPRPVRHRAGLKALAPGPGWVVGLAGLAGLAGPAAVALPAGAVALGPRGQAWAEAFSGAGLALDASSSGDLLLGATAAGSAIAMLAMLRGGLIEPALGSGSGAADAGDAPPAAAVDEEDEAGAEGETEEAAAAEP